MYSTGSLSLSSQPTRCGYAAATGKRRALGRPQAACARSASLVARSCVSSAPLAPRLAPHAAVPATQSHAVDGKPTMDLHRRAHGQGEMWIFEVLLDVYPYSSWMSIPIPIPIPQYGGVALHKFRAHRGGERHQLVHAHHLNRRRGPVPQGPQLSPYGPSQSYGQPPRSRRRLQLG